MPREMLPVTLWRDSLCFWMRMAQANAEFGLRMWQVLGFPPPRPLDSDVEAVCEAAAKPADGPDPAPRPAGTAAAKTTGTAEAPPARRAGNRRKPGARKPAAGPVPV